MSSVHNFRVVFKLMDVDLYTKSINNLYSNFRVIFKLMDVDLYKLNYTKSINNLYSNFRVVFKLIDVDLYVRNQSIIITENERKYTTKACEETSQQVEDFI